MTKKRPTTPRRSKTARAPKRSPRMAMAVATSAKQSVKQRVRAMAETPTAIYENDDQLQSALKILRDQSEPIEVRLAALQALQAASFSVVAFESSRADYIAALRAVADDPDEELRQRVLGILAREKDGFAQKKLIDGLKNPEKALLPPEKALQLLSYDLHAEAYPVARAIVKQPPSAVARREALRLLAADATAKPIFEKILLDKAETPELRRISASALQAIAPDTLQKHARAIVLDDSDADEMHATSLTAISEFGDASTLAADTKLKQQVTRMRAAPSTRVKQGAKRFLSKYGE
jgi:hypothetical protein